MKEMRNAYSTLMTKNQMKKPVGKPMYGRGTSVILTSKIFVSVIFFLQIVGNKKVEFYEYM
jgi:hypothetical protein